ncbi:GTPase domain-containing protein [Tuwongella immobilis]|uniref:Gtp-binding protein: Uncharacterized protein n=1 Tax=Tuwongella immobilis TaxID=692036 RepID=A0A6C2YNW2_9BACT|nr:GTPase domain-containing protein [Tuwongella immobilis]VIP03126.1 gtp-binding protein : Uncharacterized protein OS=Isosphaera pallida (strain ATCC 43644 / DSM 9630 / IS1B) GN=Isop_2989 PE=4 SV=1 [Tuwongella immobilis]VTS03466.1 gtp-binding protein : Uncharacterized protein OS=Isosphaera pallida (strain ATCC 43644 / DSM 9630 / IS1B) GN=Isop_2989 PE=4 SV=1 [Tuwongella immobilis]
MEATDSRTLVTRLSEDLGWLEEHTRKQTSLTPETAQLRVAAGVVRNVIGPFLDGQPPRPLHVAVVGGAGTGKSTVANLLIGQIIAEANPQAGFTRHPVAYVEGTPDVDREVTAWSSYPGFLGPLRLLQHSGPSSLDEDVYQIRKVPVPTVNPTKESALGEYAPSLLGPFVVWDCPDMTTWAATHYIPRLLEVAALSDLVVFVASDERYNDAIPTQFLSLLVQAGKSVIVVLTKMREEDGPALAAHFTQEVLDKLPPIDGARPIIPVITVPFLAASQLMDLKGSGAKYRIPLLNQTVALCAPLVLARRRAVVRGLQFLQYRLAGLLEVARRDLQALETWKSIVQQGQTEFKSRYRQEYLSSEKFQRFDETREQLVELLELPSAARILTISLWVLRFPYRFLRDQFAGMLKRPESINLPERRVLQDSLTAWLDFLRSEVLQRTEQHPMWRHIAQGFETGLTDLTRDRFEQDYRRYELGLADEVESVRRNITEGIAQSPALLMGLRVLKLVADLVAVGFAFAVTGLNWWLLLMVPLVVSLEHQVIELFCRFYVEHQREQTRLRQELLVSQTLSAPLAEWLIQWPVTGGSTFERLQRAMRRIPESIEQLSAAIQQRIRESKD